MFNFARSVLQVWDFQDGEGVSARKVFAQSKCNLAPLGDTIAYEIVAAKTADGIPGAMIQWGDIIPFTAEQLNAQASRMSGGRKKEAAQAWLVRTLSEGPKTRLQLEKLAKAAGHRWRTIERARKELGPAIEVARSKGRDSEWTWKLVSGGGAHVPPPL